MSRLVRFRSARPRGCGAAALVILALALGGCTPRVAAPPPQPQAAIAPTTPTTPQGLVQGETPPAPTDNRHRVALLLPLSGPSGGLGRAMLDAAQMALFEIGDDSLLLLPRDTGGTPDGARQAATDALRQGAQLILGPLLASEVEAVKPIARTANVNMVAFSTASQYAGDGTYLLSFLPQESVDRVTGFAHERGANTFALLAPETPYGQLIAASLGAATRQIGAQMGPVEFYDPAAKDLRPVVRQLAGFDARGAALDRQKQQLQAAGDEASKAALQRLSDQNAAGSAGFDAVMIPEGGQKLKEVASLLPYFDIDPAHVHVLGTGLWDEPGLGNEPALVGGWYAAPPPAARQDFEKRFTQTYKHAPPRLAALGYDATALAAVLAHGAAAAAPPPGSPAPPVPAANPFTAAALTDPSGFAGVDGIFRFRTDGLVERGLAVLEVERDGVKVVSPAPETFQKPAS